MTLDDLRVFVAVCRAGSLSAVARELSCTQSAVSQHVKRLEKETGVGLLERHARGVVPTAAGRILRAAAADGIGALDEALRRLDDLARGESGSVRVTTGATSVRHFMAQAIVAYRHANPQVSLEFQTVSSSRSCFEALAAHDLDLAWITMGPTERGIELRPVVELPWVLAVQEHDPLAAEPAVAPADLAASAQLILPPEHSTSRSHLDDRFAELGIAGATGAGTGIADWDTAVHLAELGLGHAVVPDLPGLRGPGHPGLALLPVPCLPPLQVGWAVRRWAALSPPARAFADLVERTCPGIPARPNG
ncbi:LysR family transcriptional regulator [Streptomyces sp. VRA16 Mangrove soil]|uniref:LysR family transcriptional regulator n=1 Tax=Streptomyces sp. VRA16 Mangrove soil TaxID=2817434 RepID=UPI001A9F69DA|nr:LysR family transcriptional regulator [Streptomyces sp. VRA16 Mangrove soil]MBO1337338.1 LysR family transcriptional regulator [Streptomyces sp. VRA16 Mangrove soil]